MKHWHILLVGSNFTSLKENVVILRHSAVAATSITERKLLPSSSLSSLLVTLNNAEQVVLAAVVCLHDRLSRKWKMVNYCFAFFFLHPSSFSLSHSSFFSFIPGTKSLFQICQRGRPWVISHSCAESHGSPRLPAVDDPHSRPRWAPLPLFLCGWKQIHVKMGTDCVNRYSFFRKYHKFLTSYPSEIVCTATDK